MKIKLFVAREIQYSELGIFSFNSYVCYLTHGFIASTRAFNLLTRTFNLPTRAFNLVTRAFKLLTRESELVTRGFELVTCGFELKRRSIARTEVLTPHFKIIPPLLGSTYFLKSPMPPTLPVNRSSQVFLININATVKLKWLNTIHVKQQHNKSFFIFKFTLKYILGNISINKIHARQSLYV